MKVTINRKTALVLRMEAMEKLRQYRLDKSLSILELRQKLKEKGFSISRQSIHDWEMGKTIPSMKNIDRIQQALNKKFI